LIQILELIQEMSQTIFWCRLLLASWKSSLTVRRTSSLSQQRPT